jgi:hypothetical protein
MIIYWSYINKESKKMAVALTPPALTLPDNADIFLGKDGLQKLAERYYYPAVSDSPVLDQYATSLADRQELTPAVEESIAKAREVLAGYHVPIYIAGPLTIRRSIEYVGGGF